MSKLSLALDEYLAVRRALGYKLHAQERLLRKFVEFADRVGKDVITTDLALSWAVRPGNVQQNWWGRRLGMVRQFARHCSAIDPRTVVPPSDLLPCQYRRPPPYIYRDEQITNLLEAARRLPSRMGLRSHTYTTLFALYAVTGMRCNEALQLDRSDVDLIHGVITVRNTKFGKSRYVPLHPTTKLALQRYAALRDRICRKARSPSFFISERGTGLSQAAAEENFVNLLCKIGLRRHGEFSRGPRIHDLRHRFATVTLLRWYRRGVDVQQHIPVLSTYIGHARVIDTYWYLTSTPELLHCAMRRVERSSGGRS